MMKALNDSPDPIDGAAEKSLAFIIMHAYKEKDFNLIINNEKLSPKEKLYAAYAIIIKSAFADHRGGGSIDQDKIITLIQDTMVRDCPFIKEVVRYLKENFSNGRLKNLQDSPEGIMIPFKLGLATLRRETRRRKTLDDILLGMGLKVRSEPYKKSTKILVQKYDQTPFEFVGCPLKYAGVTGKVHQTLSRPEALKMRVIRRLQKLGIL